MKFELMQLPMDITTSRLCAFREIPTDISDDELAMFNVVFQGNIVPPESTAQCLEDLFYVDHPQGYKGRSMSVGDVLKLDNDMYTCDSIGFKKIIRSAE